tara:strand:- start:24 stop:437 length:414 start_codon:yes stop_codon:yes gene_type:complete
VFRFIIIFIFFSSPLFANEYVSKRQDLMQKFNKLMRSANQMIKNDEINKDLSSIYAEIEIIMTEYPSLFPDDSFGGKSKASEDIILNRVGFNDLSNETAEFASLASIAANNQDYDLLQQSHKSLYGSCKSCHSRFKN